MAIIICYLCCHHIWSQFFFFKNSLHIFRIIFLSSLYFVFQSKVTPLSTLVGRYDLQFILSKSTHLLFLSTILLRVLIKFVFPIGDTINVSLKEALWQCALAPITEEVLFRGLFLSILLKTHTERQAILLSVLIFVSVHQIQSLHQIGVLAILGLILGIAFVKSRNLLLCILLHSLWNMIIFIPVTSLCPFGVL